MDRIEMNNAGTVFHNGPVVCLIVDNLSLVDKVNILKQIEEEDEKRPPASTNSMSGWKEAIERALNSQRVISHLAVRYRSGEKFDCWDICFTRPEFTDNTNVIPDQWLVKEEEFERLLLLCPNLMGIHLVMEKRENVANILDVILRFAPKLISLTFASNDEHDDLLNKKLVEIIRKRKRKMQYIDIQSRRLSAFHAREWIKTNPKLRAIHTNAMKMNFVNKYLFVKRTRLYGWTRTDRYVELCEFFNRYNFHYKKTSSDGIKLKGILYTYQVSRRIFEKIVDSFPDLELLWLGILAHVDIRRLQVMSNLKALSLVASHDYQTQAVGELLPHFDNLTVLRIEFALVSECTWHQLHTLCPLLRKVTIMRNVSMCEYEELSVEILRGICKLDELKYFEYKTQYGGYKWENRNAIEEKRSEFNVELPLNELME